MYTNLFFLLCFTALHSRLTLDLLGLTFRLTLDLPKNYQCESIKQHFI